MKKIFIFMLMLLSVVTLASCGDNNPTPGSTTTPSGTTIPTGKQNISVNSKTEIANLANEIDKAGCLEDIFIQDSNSSQKRARKAKKTNVLLADKGEEEDKSLESAIGTRELYNEVVGSKNIALNSGIAYLNIWSEEIEHDSYYWGSVRAVNKIKYRLTVDEETNSLYIETFDYVDHFVDFIGDIWGMSYKAEAEALNPTDPELYEYMKITINRNEDNKIYYEYTHNMCAIFESTVTLEWDSYTDTSKFVKNEQHQEIHSFEKVEYLEDSFYTFLSYNKEGFIYYGMNEPKYSIRQADLSANILYYTDLYVSDSNNYFKQDGILYGDTNCLLNWQVNKDAKDGIEHINGTFPGRLYVFDKNNPHLDQFDADGSADIVFDIHYKNVYSDYVYYLGLDNNYTWAVSQQINISKFTGIKNLKDGIMEFENGKSIDAMGDKGATDINADGEYIGFKAVKSTDELTTIMTKYGLTCSYDLEKYTSIALDIHNIPEFNENLYSKTETDALIETVSSYLIDREEIQKDYENAEELKTPFNLDLQFSYTADGGELITLGRKSVLKFEIKMEDIKSPIAGQIDFGAIPVLYLYIDGRMVAEQVTQIEGDALTVAFNHIFDEVKDGTMKVEVKLNSLSIDIPVAFVIVQGDTPETKNVTVDQAVDIIEAMEAGQVTEGDYIITGVISRVVEISEKHKDISVLIKDPDSGTTKQLYLFRCKKNNGAEWENFDDIVVGATIKVQGYLQKYVKHSGTTYYEIVAANVITE